MGDSLYFTRLRFSGRAGVAMLHGIRVPLTDNPTLCGQRIFQIDYTPEVGCYEIRRTPRSKPDDMTADEIAAADALLRELVGP